jgi:hypothetical protein
MVHICVNENVVNTTLVKCNTPEPPFPSLVRRVLAIYLWNVDVDLYIMPIGSQPAKVPRLCVNYRPQSTGPVETLLRSPIYPMLLEPADYDLAEDDPFVARVSVCAHDVGVNAIRGSGEC